jgi:hypothetical protein
MQYDVLSNSVETFNITTTPTPLNINTDYLEYYYTINSKDFIGLYVKNQMTGLHDASITDASMKQTNYLHFSNNGNYLILPTLSTGSNGFTFITTFSSDNSPNFAPVFELSNSGGYNDNITIYIKCSELYLNIHGTEIY